MSKPEIRQGSITSHAHGYDIVSIKQFTRTGVETLLDEAAEIKKRIHKRDLGLRHVLDDTAIVMAFDEPSTRTKGSFIAATLHLGGYVFDAGMHTRVLDEGFIHTIETYASVSDGLVVRHPDVRAAELAATHSPKPIISGGNGIGEHPTQALLDLFTMREHRGSLDGITVGIVGDAKHGRTVHSLLKGLSLFRDTTVILASPDALRLQPEETKEYTSSGMHIEQVNDPQKIPSHSLDVSYWTRLQKERLGDTILAEGLAAEIDSRFSASVPLLNRLDSGNMILMHPLPRNNELPFVLDHDPRSMYFEQAGNGLPVRMALLQGVFGK